MTSSKDIESGHNLERLPMSLTDVANREVLLPYRQSV